MLLSLAICTATHGLNWLPSDVAESELVRCRAAFGDLPDFDSGDVGFEGVVALGERVFAVRCFRAVKWDFMERDAIYLAVTCFSRAVAQEVDLKALWALPLFREPMRDPPRRFECPTIAETGGICLQNLVGELADGIAMRREIGETVFVPMATTVVQDEAEPLPTNPHSPPLSIDHSHPVVRSRCLILMWTFLAVVIAGVLALCIVLLRNTMTEKEGAADDRSGKAVESRGISGALEGTNDVSGRTVSDEGKAIR